jgi:S-adenosylmethionine-diacylgycerolhomoserine-N-methlytransferase
LEKKESIIKYYKKQSVFYDITRPAFLFGRCEIVRWIAESNDKGTLLEIGCGTGHILKSLAKSTDCKLAGIDLSPEMLAIAKRKLPPKINLYQTDLTDFNPVEKYDAILLSYVFTLDFAKNEEHIKKVKQLLKPDGRIYVVDFHKYGSTLYKRYMNWHGIEMGEELLALLESEFATKRKSIRKAYGGVWEYFIYEGVNVGD